MNSFPYTNFHELNLDWILEKIKNCEKIPADIREKLASLETYLPLSVNAVHKNLLDNTNFVQPINQRGAAYISGAGYPVDRWYFTSGTCTPAANGLFVLAGAQDASLVQRVGHVESGVYTSVFNVNGEYLYYIVRVTGTTVETLDDSHRASGAVNLLFSYNWERECFEIGASVAAGFSATFINAALYPFECRNGILPDYVPKSYSEELSECERYYYVVPEGMLVFATNAPNQRYNSSSVEFPPMRDGITPTPIWQYYPEEQSGMPNAFGVVSFLRFLNASDVDLTVHKRHLYLTAKAADLAGCAMEHLKLFLDAEY